MTPRSPTASDTSESSARTIYGTPSGTASSEDGASTPMLLARSRHASVRSLERYARPGPEAVARHVARTDPAARRRHPEH